MLGLSAAVFTAPGFAVFTDLLTGWVLTPGRRTITRMLTVADPHGRRAHDAYHRFIRAGAWDMVSALWRALAVHAIERFYPDGVVIVDCDDTVYKKVLWYRACPRRLVRLVVVRDPTGTQPDDFFVTSAPAARPQTVATGYAGRWSIEVTNRDAKQALGGEDPQSWKGQGPARAAALSLWLHTAIWCWYLSTHADTITWRVRPWYRHKCSASFTDALAALRRHLWQQRITAMSASPAHRAKITDALLDTLAEAA